MKGDGLLLAVVTAVVIGAIVTGFLLIGTPRASRKVELDRIRVENLRDLSNGILYSWNKRSRLPPRSLEAYMEGEPIPSGMRDPVTKVPYGYRDLDNGRFELCATFDTEIVADEADFGAEWAHPAGPHCFRFDVNQQD